LITQSRKERKENPLLLAIKDLTILVSDFSDQVFDFSLSFVVNCLL
jgi:hypothetical protein